MFWIVRPVFLGFVLFLGTDGQMWSQQTLWPGCRSQSIHFSWRLVVTDGHNEKAKVFLLPNVNRGQEKKQTSTNRFILIYSRGTMWRILNNRYSKPRLDERHSKSFEGLENQVLNQAHYFQSSLEKRNSICVELGWIIITCFYHRPKSFRFYSLVSS